MLRIEHRKMFRPNGLIDDFVVYGKPADYLDFSEKVGSSIGRSGPISIVTESFFVVEIRAGGDGDELFTSLQNEEDFYCSMDDWNRRSILRVVGSAGVLSELQQFLTNLSWRGEGYSYISEYSGQFTYANSSPQWRLHVQQA